MRLPGKRHGCTRWNGRPGFRCRIKGGSAGRRLNGPPRGPRLVDEMLGSCESRSVRGDRSLPGCVPPLAHRTEGAARFHRSEEAVDESELALDDERNDVVGKASRSQAEVRADEARLAPSLPPEVGDPAGGPAL